MLTLVVAITEAKGLVTRQSGQIYHLIMQIHIGKLHKILQLGALTKNDHQLS